MSGNDLLLWMSARREGSWQQFRAAVEELHVSAPGMDDSQEDETSDRFDLPLYQALRLNLQRLGHAEFFAGAGDAEWRVTPPSLAVTLSTRGWIGVMAGARSPNLMRRIHVASNSLRLNRSQFPACPDQFVFGAEDPEALAGLAENVGLCLQRDAPTALLACLPPIDDPAVRHRVPLPLGSDWKIERFSPEDLRWLSARREEAESTAWGLFRFALRHQRQVLVCSRGEAFRVPVQVGKFLALRRYRRRQPTLEYASASRTLAFPVICRPPFLVERALILCSGALPTFAAGAGRSTLSYTGIPEQTAATTAELLRQRLS